MLRNRRLAGIALVLPIALATGGCTLAKPLVGIVTGPVVILAHSNGSFCGCSGGSGEGVLAVLGLAAAVGGVAGLVTGIVSDVRVVCGYANDPCSNWADPFAINH